MGPFETIGTYLDAPVTWIGLVFAVGIAVGVRAFVRTLSSRGVH